MELMKKYLEYIKEHIDDADPREKWVSDVEELFEQIDKVIVNTLNLKMTIDNVDLLDFVFTDELSNERIRFELETQDIQLKIFTYFGLGGVGTNSKMRTEDISYGKGVDYIVDNIIEIIVEFIIKQKIYINLSQFEVKPIHNDIFLGIFKHNVMKKLKESYEYQKYLIEKGEIYKLKDVKINDKTTQEYPEMKDVKKQIEWS